MTNAELRDYRETLSPVEDAAFIEAYRRARSSMNFDRSMRVAKAEVKKLRFQATRALAKARP